MFLTLKISMISFISTLNLCLSFKFWFISLICKFIAEFKSFMFHFKPSFYASKRPLLFYFQSFCDKVIQIRIFLSSKTNLYWNKWTFSSVKALKSCSCVIYLKWQWFSWLHIQISLLFIHTDYSLLLELLEAVCSAFLN